MTYYLTEFLAKNLICQKKSYTFAKFFQPVHSTTWESLQNLS